MRLGATIRLCAAVGIAAMLVALIASPAAATAEAIPAEYEYDASELLADGSITLEDGELTLLLDGTAREGETIRIEIDEDHRSAFDISDGTDATGGDIGIAVATTDDSIEIELTDLDSDRNVTGTEIAVDVDLTASETAAGRFEEDDPTPIASVTDDGTESGLDGEETIAVRLSRAGEIGFDADEIDEYLHGTNNRTTSDDSFTISFADESVWVNHKETINISVDPNAVSSEDRDGVEITGAGEKATQDANISSVDVTTSGDANVLDGDDQLTVAINTVDGEPQLVSDEAVSINVRLAIQTESMKYAADRYRGTDLFAVDVEGEGNVELDDNADIKTGSPLAFDIHSGEADTDGFELQGIESESAFPIEENRTLAVDELTDRFGNEIRRAELEFGLEGNADGDSYPGVRMATDGSEEISVENGGAIDTRLGVFDLSAEVTDVEGPATQSENTGEAVTETVDDVSIYPGHVTVESNASYRDFDVDGANIELAVDLGVPEDDVDRVDIQLRRESGNGAVRFDPAAAEPTDTDLWEETGYAGDGYLGQENPWAIERGLTTADFDDGIRTYVLEADAADSYEITVEVMPRDDRLVPDETAVETSLSETTDGDNRDGAEIVATGAIDAVGNVSLSTDREFVGVEVDEGDGMEITLDAFEDAAGNAVTNTDETVPVRVGETTVATVSPTVGESTTASVDPTEIELSGVETGTGANVTIEFEDGGQQNATDLTLVHRAIERSGGTWRAASLPQPATVYIDADGDRDVAQWNPNTDGYESVATDATDDVLEAEHVGHEHLHRGLYVYSADGDLRMGYDYTTDADEAISAGDIELEAGWHLASSNYDTSAHPRQDLVDDVNWAGYGFGSEDDAFSIWNADLTERVHDRTAGFDVDGSTESVEQDDVYWIRINDEEEPLTRGVVSPTFSERDGIEG